jgi:peroxiredoxin
LGFQVLALSPDRPEKLRGVLKEGEERYLLLSDSTMRAAIEFGLAFRVDDETVARFKKFSIDLEEASGEDHHLLPVPAVFVTGKDGTIEFQYVNPDYRVRLDPDVLVAAARAAVD